MVVLPSTQPVAALALFCLPLMWLARVVYLAYVEATVFGVGMNTGCDACNDDGRTSPGSAIAIAMKSGEASIVRWAYVYGMLNTI